MKLDFRFADENDADDIEEFCRSRMTLSDLIVPSNVISDDSCRGDVKWVVLETPAPDEDICACARMKFHNDGMTLTIDSLAIIDSSDASIYALKVLLSKIESIGRNFNRNVIEIEVAVMKESLAEIISSQGYIETGGYHAPANVESGRVTETMIICHRKDLSQPLSMSKLAPQVTSDILGENFEISESNGIDTQMGELVTGLFAALHSKYPDT